MKAIIVEDEKYAANRLERLVKSHPSNIEVIERFDSIEDTVDYLSNGDESDFLFLDIHLADGLSFEIFQKVRYEKPVIFTTAYDDYSLKAFKLNSIDYLLKPINMEELNQAVDKMIRLRHQNTAIDLAPITEYFKKSNYKKRFLSKTGNKYTQLNVEDCILFYADGKIVYCLSSNDHKKHIIDHTIEELNNLLNPSDCFKINRKVIINARHIQEIQNYEGNRLMINCSVEAPFELLVSRERVSLFKKWLDQ
ncbi:MAG: LytTR family DNA-binding domain-containing protein [Bacteroidota bacterium]